MSLLVVAMLPFRFKYPLSSCLFFLLMSSDGYPYPRIEDSLQCKRAGCLYRHKWKLAGHGYCCNACRFGERWHTRNCHGYGCEVLEACNEFIYGLSEEFPQCNRAGCPYRHMEKPRDHGYCCNACRLGHSCHTRNCSGYGWPVVEAGMDPCMVSGDEKLYNSSHHHHLLRVPSFRLPPSWHRGNANGLDFVSWYMHRYGLYMDAGTRRSWSVFSEHLEGVSNHRRVSLYAFAEGRVPDRFAHTACINVGDTLTAHSSLYQQSKVTGMDFRVQAVLITQAMTAHILSSAVDQIEHDELEEFAFVCRCATHRSVACCVLLGSLVYPNATLHFSTRRTQQAAEAHIVFMAQDSGKRARLR